VNELLPSLTGYRKLQSKPYLALSRYTWLKSSIASGRNWNVSVL